jgi:anti-anti-sigma factor
MTTLSRPSAVTSSSDEDRASLRVVGDLDGLAVAQLHQVINGHLAAGRRFLRLDMSGVTEIDDDGLRLILDTHHRVLAQRGTLILIGAAANVTRTIRAADRDDVLFLLERFASDPLAE